MEDMNNTIRQRTLTFIEHSTQQGSTFFPSIDQTFTKINAILGHKIGFNKFKRAETMSWMTKN